MSARGTPVGSRAGVRHDLEQTVVKARVIGEADAAHHSALTIGHSIACGIAEPYPRPGQPREHLVYPDH